MVGSACVLKQTSSRGWTQGDRCAQPRGDHHRLGGYGGLDDPSSKDALVDAFLGQPKGSGERFSGRFECLFSGDVAAVGSHAGGGVDRCGAEVVSSALDAPKDTRRDMGTADHHDMVVEVVVAPVGALFGKGAAEDVEVGDGDPIGEPCRFEFGKEVV